MSRVARAGLAIQLVARRTDRRVFTRIALSGADIADAAVMVLVVVVPAMKRAAQQRAACRWSPEQIAGRLRSMNPDQPEAQVC